MVLCLLQIIVAQHFEARMDMPGVILAESPMQALMLMHSRLESSYFHGNLSIDKHATANINQVKEVLVQLC